MMGRLRFLGIVICAAALIWGCSDDSTGGGGVEVDTSSPGGEDTTSSGSGDTASSGGEDTTSSGGRDTTSSGGEDTTSSGSGDTTSSGGQDTTSSGDTASEDVDTGPPVCANVDVEFEPVTPTVVLLIDQSGSMVVDFANGLDRWEATYQALMGPQGVVTTLEASVRFGLALYTYDDTDVTLECPVITDVAPGLSNRAAIDAVYAPEAPWANGDTPTGHSIQAILPTFEQVEGEGPRVILLATDGEPDTCDIPDPSTPEDQETTRNYAVSAAQEAHAAGVETFILSVGADISDAHLQDMANAGQGLAVDGSAGDASFWKATDSDQLALAINEIITGQRSCIFRVNGARIVEEMADSGTVTLNGDALGFEDGDGWVLHQSSPPCPDDGDCIELQGSACQTLLDEAVVDLSATFPCDAVIFF